MDYLKKALTWTSPIPKRRPITGFHASAASAYAVDLKGKRNLFGRCLRAQFLRMKEWEDNELEGARTGCDTSWLGNWAHEGVYDKFRAAGMYVDSEIPMWNPAHNVSGRADLIFRGPADSYLCGADIKSTWGYMGEGGVIKPRRDAPLFPKYDHIFQCAVYLDWFKQYGVNTWAVFYVHRGSGAYGEHYIKILDYTPWIKQGMATPEQKQKHGKIEVSNAAGTVVLDVGMEDIYDRWDTLHAHLTNSSIPPRDYTMQYGEERIEKMIEDKELSKTKKIEYGKNNFVAVGDWRCRFCSNSGHCYNNDQWKTPKSDQEILSLKGA